MTTATLARCRHGLRAEVCWYCRTKPRLAWLPNWPLPDPPPAPTPDDDEEGDDG